MSNKTDSNVYTILFAIGMVVVVGALLAFTAASLKPNIAENVRLEKQQNILYAMGVNENDESSAVFVDKTEAPELFKKYITKQLVIKGGDVSENNEAYLIDIKKQKAIGNDNPSERKLPLFVGEKDGKTYYVVPIYGKGLWDAIWGYVSLDKDMVVQGAYFDHKGETPGLGANIKERFFMDDFIGEHLLDESGYFKGIDVAKGNADPKNENKTDNEVDAIAGATITGNGVTAMIKSDLKLYKPYFDNLKNN
ncbi:Na(+)-translocating NADH-quinone reductase subunit C [Seonamhaeicola algicola]|uniref:Na(+)-translocating NADH-quinone reductase subunit C n=1 Tax=Seonamhaeicola algicola TaxID=1719036 RepID=A0A5C7AH04_9FLAO|nr:Na(+)-translocating NADH-quinone reductase subunit C [Seonamhaeicola algicola]TXE07179.1 Na(+)-translocating NADH-quinone reductase subunit C [Seonamhaeicola algicola]